MSSRRRSRSRLVGPDHCVVDLGFAVETRFSAAGSRAQKGNCIRPGSVDFSKLFHSHERQCSVSVFFSEFEMPWVAIP